jgi:hypothetical protein
MNNKLVFGVTLVAAPLSENLASLTRRGPHTCRKRRQATKADILPQAKRLKLPEELVVKQILPVSLSSVKHYGILAFDIARMWLSCLASLISFSMELV